MILRLIYSVKGPYIDYHCLNLEVSFKYHLKTKQINMLPNE